MTTELFWLTLTLLLAASLWIPVIARITTTPDGTHSADGVARYSAMSLKTQLANRAHMNLLEQSMPFAALILLAHLVDAHSAVTAIAAIAFFWIRVVHMVIMLTGVQQIPLRPIVFTSGWVCCLAIGVEILRLG